MSQNYKDTLNLPRTDFPMKANLPAREPELLKQWEETRLYQQIQNSRKGRELFVLHDGPPFANGDVHMGTALNKILKDFVVKSQTMLGKRAPYVPGWDCHGLPIEYKVVKESRALSPLEVRKKCEAFARKFINIQREQFKRLGVFGDWENPYLTMDPKYEAEILRAFAVFVEEGLVYRAQKPVFWSTGAQTALAEAEVEYQERDDTAVYVKFPLTEESERLFDYQRPINLVIWTTTPWTLPANLAVAFNPRMNYFIVERGGESYILAQTAHEVPIIGAISFHESGKRYGTSVSGQLLRQLTYRHPFLNRTGKVLAADFVTPETGTGLVHIAPGHGEDDYWLGRTNNLGILSPVDDHGRFTEEAGLPNLTGKYVFDANRDIVQLLKERGMLLAVQNFHHSYPYCWRSKTPIIFRNVEQFFIRIDALRDKALEAIHKEVKWIPAWGENRIAGTVESRPDWVISRQRSWGVPLPVFYSKDGDAILDAKIIRKLADLIAERGSNIWFELDDAKSGTYEKPTAADHFVGRNGADLLRLWASSIDYTSDVPFSEEMFTRLGDTYRRIRNTLRILLGNLYDFAAVAGGGDPGRPASPMPATTLIDRWILQRLDEVICDCRLAYEAFEFHKVYHALNQFCAVDLSSLYIDITKDRMYCDAPDSPRRRATQMVMREIFNALCRLLAPILAFTAEEAWRHSAVAGIGDAGQPGSPTPATTSVHLQEFPEPEDRDGKIRPQAARRGEGAPSAQVAELLRLRGVIAQAIERARQEKLIGNTLEARVVLYSDSGVTEEVGQEELEEFFIVSDLTVHHAKEASASVTKTPYAKCARCWRHRPTVGTSTAHPDLCDRCERVITALEKTAP